MPTIKPNADLRSYTEILDEVAQGSSVLLANRGRVRCATQDISDCERREAEDALLSQLEHGRRAADEQGTLATEQIHSVFAERFTKQA